MLPAEKKKCVQLRLIVITTAVYYGGRLNKNNSSRHIAARKKSRAHETPRYRRDVLKRVQVRLCVCGLFFFPPDK